MPKDMPILRPIANDVLDEVEGRVVGYDEDVKVGEGFVLVGK